MGVRRTDAPDPALHGFTGSGVDWAPLAEQVAGEWVAPDLLGHGGCSYADPARYAFAAQAADVEALRAALGWERPLLVGYSFGARLALAALARDPSAYAGAVLIGGTAGIPDPVRRACRLADDRVRADVLRHVGAPAFLSSWARRPLLATQARIQSADRTRMAGARGLHSAEGLALSLRGAGTGSMPSLWEDLAQITTPTLLLCGAEDPKFCGLGRDLARALPAATCVTIPAAGHCAHLEAPQASAAAVGEFLSSLESR
ncbi:MAG: alpha/beta fold hydrolase [Planctomycetes bacterium]|nr:alpha/beta fold hydrolase [Planctomycetota bacterium]